MSLRIRFIALVSNRPTLLFTTMALVAGLSVYIGLSSRSSSVSLPADEDALVSYLQSATSLSELLKQKLDASSKNTQVSGLVVPSASKSVDLIETACEKTLQFQEALKAARAESRQKQSKKHFDLVRTTKAACDKTNQLHVKKPSILAKDWDRYWKALSYCGDLP